MAEAEIICIGDELLNGRILNTNGHWLGHTLFSAGVSVRRQLIIRDEADAIREVVEQAPTPIVITTGGLGATSDDVTRQTLADWVGAPLAEHKPTTRRLTEWYARRGKKLNELTAKMAFVPEGAVVLGNSVGAAPGFRLEKDGKLLYAVPGVPHEMQAVINEAVIPDVQQGFDLPTLEFLNFRTASLTESAAAKRLAEIERALPDYLNLAYNPGVGFLNLRLTYAQPLTNAAAAYAQYKETGARMREALGADVFAEGDVPLEEVVGNLLADKGLTLATAESCTGGRLAAAITAVPGSSRYFPGGVNSYANEVKTAVLGVKPETLATVGAVSEETACQMAEGVRARLKTDLALSTTGIAGPGGGSDEKPVGTVWIGFSDGKQTFARKFLFGDARERNLQRSVAAALELLRRELVEGK